MDYVFEEYFRKSDYQTILLSHFSNVGCKQIFEKRELIESKHRPLDEIYLIIKGKVKQYYVSNDGMERTILLLAEGDMFGEITLYQGDFDMVISEALEETEVRRIDKDILYQTLNSNPHLYNAILEMVTTKFRILMAQIYDSSFFPTNNRLINLLIRLSRQYGIPSNDDSLKINVKLTHQEIANMIGTTRSTVSKTLKSLTDNGLIYQQNKYIFLTKDFLDAKLR